MLASYDGSFAGLLCLLAWLLELGLEPSAVVTGEPCQPDLFATPSTVAADPDRARAFQRELAQRHGPGTVRRVYRAWLSQDPQVGPALYRYLARGRRLGSGLDRHLADPAVAMVHALDRQVAREAHRVKGLVRFRELADGLWYAPVRPRALVLPLLGRHFSARLAPAAWLIHDVPRGIGLLGGGGRWTLGEIGALAPPAESAGEQQWQALWRRFVREVAIPERTNRQQQRRNLPRRYWAELVEFCPGGLSPAAGEGGGNT